MPHTKLTQFSAVNNDDGSWKNVEEKIVDGDKGLTLKVYIKTNNNQHKYIAKSNPDGTFIIIHITDKQKNMQENQSLDSVISEFNKFAKDHNQKLDITMAYLKKVKDNGGYKHPKNGRGQIGRTITNKKGGSKKSTKKSKRTSKKRSTMKKTKKAGSRRSLKHKRTSKK